MPPAHVHALVGVLHHPGAFEQHLVDLPAGGRAGLALQFMGVQADVGADPGLLHQRGGHLHLLGHRAHFQGDLQRDGAGVDIESLLVGAEAFVAHREPVGIEGHLMEKEAAVRLGLALELMLRVERVGQLHSRPRDRGSGFVHHRAADHGGGLRPERQRAQQAPQAYAECRTGFDSFHRNSPPEQRRTCRKDLRSSGKRRRAGKDLEVKPLGNPRGGRG